MSLDTLSALSLWVLLLICLARLWYHPELPRTPAGEQVRDKALQALGMIVIGKPQLMLQQLQLSLLDHLPGATAATRVSDRGSPNHTGGAAAATAAGSTAEDGMIDDAAAAAEQQRSADVPRCVAEVYAAALAGQQYSIAVKTRVLTNFVELLRWVVCSCQLQQARQ